MAISLDTAQENGAPYEELVPFVTILREQQQKKEEAARKAREKAEREKAELEALEDLTEEDEQIYSLVKDNVDLENDYLITLGSKGNSYFNKRGYNIVHSINEETTGFEQEASKQIASKALEMFTNNSVGEVHIIYTKFVNSLTFRAEDLKLLPVEVEKKEVSGPTQELMIEPDANEVLNELLPFYFNSVIYGSLIESHVSEQASRRTAMENATDNAEEISDKLLIQYNKARQSAITQEITEVVAGANASS